MPVGTTALILGGLAAAQTAKSVVDSRSAAKGARKTANYEGNILDQQAQDALDIGAQSANRAAQSGRSLEGSQRASIGASGIDASGGSAADIVANDQKLNALDVLTIQDNAAREAFGLKKQATLVRMGGKNQAKGYNNQATGSLLSGAASLYGIYSAYGQNTTPRKTTTSGPSANSGGYGAGTASR